MLLKIYLAGVPLDVADSFVLTVDLVYSAVGLVRDVSCAKMPHCQIPSFHLVN